MSDKLVCELVNETELMPDDAKAFVRKCVLFGEKQVLETLLLVECPVKYYNGREANAVPVDFIKKRLLLLEKEMKK